MNYFSFSFYVIIVREENTMKKTKKKTYAVQKKTYDYLVQINGFMIASSSGCSYPCDTPGIDPELIKKGADLWLEVCPELEYDGVVDFSVMLHSGRFINNIGYKCEFLPMKVREALWFIGHAQEHIFKFAHFKCKWPWLKKVLLQRDIFGYGASFQLNIYEGYQRWCRYFDGMFNEEEIRVIMKTPLSGRAESGASYGWDLLKKYAE